MRIYISSDHQYPARIGGLGSQRVSDVLVKGLGELGHDVFYHLKNEIREPLPPGIHLVAEPMFDVDILHLQDAPLSGLIHVAGKPWVRTYHAAVGNHKIENAINPHLIFVSAAHANCFGSNRFVYNAIDPAEYVYAESKADYFLFIVSGLERAWIKGLDIALMLVEELGMPLVIAGSSKDNLFQRRFAKMCQARGVVFVGEIYGQKKAELLAGARALLFPTTFEEPFGLVAVEALISGTPVICSDKGACPELISADVGFVCSHKDDYIAAIAGVQNISPQKCREQAMSRFHYLKMAADYVKEYELQICQQYG